MTISSHQSRRDRRRPEVGELRDVLVLDAPSRSKVEEQIPCLPFAGPVTCLNRVRRFEGGAELLPRGPGRGDLLAVPREAFPRIDDAAGTRPRTGSSSFGCRPATPVPYSGAPPFPLRPFPSQGWPSSRTSPAALTAGCRRRGPGPPPSLRLQEGDSRQRPRPRCTCRWRRPRSGRARRPRGLGRPGRRHRRTVRPSTWPSMPCTPDRSPEVPGVPASSRELPGCRSPRPASTAAVPCR